MPLKTIIGLDISTAIIGVSIVNLDDSGAIESAKTFAIKPKPSKSATLEQTINHAQSLLMPILATYCIKSKEQDTRIIIEDILTFLPNKSNSKTIITLAAINFALAAFIEKTFAKQIQRAKVATVRATLRKAAGLKGRLSKEDVPQALTTILGDKMPTMKVLDESDALALAVAASIKINQMDAQQQEEHEEQE